MQKTPHKRLIPDVWCFRCLRLKVLDKNYRFWQFPCQHPKGRFLLYWFACPHFTLLDSGTGRRITVFRVAGIPCQKFARNVGTFTAMRKAFALTAICNGALTVKGMTVCFDTTIAVAGLFVCTTAAMQSAS